MSTSLSKSKPSLQLISIAFMLLRRLARIQRGVINNVTAEAESYVTDMINLLPPMAVFHAQRAVDTEELARAKAEDMDRTDVQTQRDCTAEQALNELNNLLRWRELHDEDPRAARTANRPEDNAGLTACEQAMYERSMAYPDHDEPTHEPSWQLLSAAQAQIGELTTRVDALAALAENRQVALEAVGKERDKLDEDCRLLQRECKDLVWERNELDAERARLRKALATLNEAHRAGLMERDDAEARAARAEIVLASMKPANDRLLAKEQELRDALRTCKEALRVVTKELGEVIHREQENNDARD